jgi:hypothetical protein
MAPAAAEPRALTHQLQQQPQSDALSTSIALAASSFAHSFSSLQQHWWGRAAPTTIALLFCAPPSSSPEP